MKDRQYNDKKEKVKWNKLIHKRLHRKDRSTRTPQKTTQKRSINTNPTKNYTEKIDQHEPNKKLHRKDRSTRTPQKTTQKTHEPHKKLHVNSDAMEGLAVPASVGDIHRITFKRYKHHLFQTVMLTKFYIMYQ